MQTLQADGAGDDAMWQAMGNLGVDVGSEQEFMDSFNTEMADKLQGKLETDASLSISADTAEQETVATFLAPTVDSMIKDMTGNPADTMQLNITDSGSTGGEAVSISGSDTDMTLNIDLAHFTDSSTGEVDESALAGEISRALLEQQQIDTTAMPEWFVQGIGAEAMKADGGLSGGEMMAAMDADMTNFDSSGSTAEQQYAQSAMAMDFINNELGDQNYNMDDLYLEIKVQQDLGEGGNALWSAMSNLGMNVNDEQSFMAAFDGYVTDQINNL
jgi:hypothetical protein